MSAATLVALDWLWRVILSRSRRGARAGAPEGGARG